MNDISGAVDIEKIYTTRSAEIDKLERIIRGDFQRKNVRAFQQLPRHMRRRTMSHNPYRLPKRLQKKAIHEINKSGNPPSKKKKRRYRTIKRRSNRFLRDYGKRQIDKKWLDTHLWHAKRFHMVNKWGYRIGRTPTNKGARAAYRSCRTHSVIYEASHTAPIVLTGSERSIIKVMKEMTNGVNVGSGRYIKGNKGGYVDIVDFSTQNYVVTCDFFWTTKTHEDKRKFFIWVHPAAYDDVSILFNVKLERFDDVEISQETQKYARFELLGPKSNRVFKKALREHKPNGENKFETIINNRSGYLPEGCIVNLKVADPRVRLNYLNPISESPSNEDALLNWPSEWSESTLWENEESVINTLTENEINDFKSDIDVLMRSNTDIVLVQKPGGKDGFGEGWTIFMHSSWAMTFWKAFIYAGARAIGLEEIQQISFEKERLFYPYDYPETDAYKEESEITCKDLEEKNEKKPKGKRPNYESLNITSPFITDWRSLLGGTIKIFRPKKLSDLEKVDRTTQTLIPVCIDLGNGGTYLKDRAQILIEDKIVGYITTGRYSWHSGICKGFGYILSSSLPEGTTEPILVKVRNLTSQFHHKVSLKVHFE
eukprot:TRINITY_DN3219_c0_g1_i1.p1 TRINITY_DN3219_c0_g1~~TRINITY_DN3219_c0_g1_i1.p1  ORF type:complete len:598 (+),score=128.36 TRINITY_DN3219_c0_g1_i1:3-1796(+)